MKQLPQIIYKKINTEKKTSIFEINSYNYELFNNRKCSTHAVVIFANISRSFDMIVPILMMSFY